MASNKVIAFAVLAIFVPSVAVATQFIVGDDKGWTLGVDYTQWTAGKTFHVGDTLVFNYNSSMHNVLKVDGPAFKGCVTTGNPLTTGKDEIEIKTSGKKWYICGVGNHCQQGLKLVLDVVSDAPAPAPNAASHEVTSLATLVVAMAISAFAMILV